MGLPDMARLAALVAALTASLAIPAAAHAGGSVTPVPAPPLDESGARNATAAGPVFAGDLAAVAQRVRGRVEVWGVGNGRRRVLARLPRAGGALGLAASESTWAVSSYLQTGDCGRSINCRVAFDRVDAGPLGSPPDVSFGCDERSSTCGGINPPTCTRRVLDVSGDLLAYVPNTGYACGPPTVVDRANPAAATTYEGAEALRIAGNFVAYGTGDGIRVHDRVRNAEVLRVRTDQNDNFDIQPDGKLVFTEVYQPEGQVMFSDRVERVAWASPADPASHPIPEHPGNRVLRIAGDRIAVGSTSIYSRGLNVLVYDLAGKPLVQHDASESVADWEFDGARLTWKEQPCVSGQVVIWDMSGAPPKPPGGRCPLGRISRATRTLDDNGEFRLPVTCPRAATLGCAASLELIGTPRGRSKPVAVLSGSAYNLHHGESVRLRIRLSKDARRFVRRHREVTVRAPATGLQRSGTEPAASGTTRFVLRP